MKSFIISNFNYCPILWMFCLNKSNRLINRIHERSLRIAYNDYTSNFDTLLEKDNSTTIHMRNIQQLMLEVYRTLNNLNPKFMNEIFKYKQHNYNTRKQHLIYPNPHTSSHGLQSFGYKSCQLWDLLPHEIQNADNVELFISHFQKISKLDCTCNLCRPYLKNLGYIN